MVLRYKINPACLLCFDLPLFKHESVTGADFCEASRPSCLETDLRLSFRGRRQVGEHESGMESQEAVGNVRIDGGEETGQLAYFLLALNISFP